MRKIDVFMGFDVFLFVKKPAIPSRTLEREA